MVRGGLAGAPRARSGRSSASARRGGRSHRNGRGGWGEGGDGTGRGGRGVARARTHPSRDRLRGGGGLVAQTLEDDGYVLGGHRGDQPRELLHRDAHGVSVAEPSQRLERALLQERRVALRGGLAGRHRARKARGGRDTPRGERTKGRVGDARRASASARRAGAVLNRVDELRERVRPSAAALSMILFRLVREQRSNVPRLLGALPPVTRHFIARSFVDTMFASRMMRRVARKLAEVRARDARSRPFTRDSTLPIGGIRG